MIAISISPDIQEYMLGIGTSFIVLKDFDGDNPNLEEIMKYLYTTYPDLKAGLDKRNRIPKIMCGKSSYTLSI